MSGGGKGGSQTSTTKVEIPDWLEEPAKRNIAKAEEIAKTGYVPYMGPDVAALTPMQQAAMQSTGMAADAYGLPNAMGNQITPEPQTFAGGLQGYSAFPLYEQSIDQLYQSRPGQYNAMMAPFLDPVTGAGPSGVFAGEQPDNANGGKGGGSGGASQRASIQGGDYGGGGGNGIGNNRGGGLGGGAHAGGIGIGGLY
jgi:hypothetical protein